MNPQVQSLQNWQVRYREFNGLMTNALLGAYAILYPEIPSSSITVWDYEGAGKIERVCAFLPGYTSTVFGRDRTVFRRHPVCSAAENHDFVGVLNHIMRTVDRRVISVEPIEAGGQILFLVECEVIE